MDREGDELVSGHYFLAMMELVVRPPPASRVMLVDTGADAPCDGEVVDSGQTC